MLGNPLRALAVAALTVAAAAGCDRGRADPVSTPPVAAVEVPVVPPESERSTAGNERSERSPPSPADEFENFESVEEDGLSLEQDDAGVVHFSAASDAGVRFWGSFSPLDGGFRFQGGFSMGAPGSDGGAP
jgi:hypothetical protein